MMSIIDRNKQPHAHMYNHVHGSSILLILRFFFVCISAFVLSHVVDLYSCLMSVAMLSRIHQKFKKHNSIIPSNFGVQGILGIPKVHFVHLLISLPLDDSVLQSPLQDTLCISLHLLFHGQNPYSTL